MDSTEEPSTQDHSLPDDLLVICFTRVSKLYYPTLSLVSKRFCSLLASSELYEVRSLLGRTESCFYVCFESYPDSKPLWFTLCRKPNRITDDTERKKKKSSGYVLAPIQIPHSPQAHWEGMVSVGSNIYAIGGSTLSSSVSILDCRSHTWHKAPSMRVERSYPSTHVFYGKIYVAGGCEDTNYSNWMEVFDPETQTWELVSSPDTERSTSRVCKGVLIDGEICMFGYKDRWEVIEGFDYLDLGRDPRYCNVKLADYGGKMVVLWGENLRSSGYQNKMIWCAVIALGRRNNEEIWGNVEWFDGVLTVPKSYEFMCALDATV